MPTETPLASSGQALDAGDVAALDPSSGFAAPGTQVVLFVAKDAFDPDEGDDEPTTTTESTTEARPTETTTATTTTSSSAETSSSAATTTLEGTTASEPPVDPPADPGTADPNAGAAEAPVAP